MMQDTKMISYSAHYSCSIGLISCPKLWFGVLDRRRLDPCSLGDKETILAVLKILRGMWMSAMDLLLFRGEISS